ncbi:hypothetical protein C0995_006182 [Termitomyces sp. Mi166|nr:hypothetical protein C0995_006182 [Termitomyces sp. Mi166\
MSLAQPLPPTDPLSFGLYRDYPVFVPPKPKLQLPSHLYTLKLKLSLLWLTRTPRKSRPEQPSSFSPTDSDNPLKPRTPVFTRPPLPTEEPFEPSMRPPLPVSCPAPSFIVNLNLDDSSPVPMPIKLPQLLPFTLTTNDEVFDWDSQPSVVLSPMGNIDTVSPKKRARRGRVGGAKYASPLLPSRTKRDRDVVGPPSAAVWEHDWMPLERSFVDYEDPDSPDDGDLFWPDFSCDEEYFGDTEDSSSDSEEETTRAAVGPDGGAKAMDCFSWLDAELEYLSLHEF